MTQSAALQCIVSALKQPGMNADHSGILMIQASFQALQISASLGTRISDANQQENMQCRRDRSVTQQALALSVACHALIAGLRMTNSTNLRRLTAKDAEHAVQSAYPRQHCQHTLCCLIDSAWHSAYVTQVPQQDSWN